MSLRFERIDTNDGALLDSLEQSLLKILPESVHMIVLLRIARLKRFPPNVNVEFHIYCDENKKVMQKFNEDNSPFIVCIQQPNFHTSKGVILLTPQNPTERMIQTFDSFLNWNEPQMFQCVQQPFWETIWELSRSHGQLIPTASHGIPMILYAILDLQKAKNLEVNKEKTIEIRELLKSDAPRIVESWEKPHAKDVITQCIGSGSLLSCATFENGEMASSVLQSPLGSYNMLRTPDKFRGRGLAQLVMRWISREGALKMEIFPLAEVETFNEASKAILIKTGFQEMYQTRWFLYKPK